MIKKYHIPDNLKKKLKSKGTNDKWEFSVTMNYRCVYRKENSQAFILLLTKHEDVF